METTYTHRRDRNLLEIQERVQNVQAAVIMNYKAHWDSVQMPMQESELTELDASLRTEALSFLENRLAGFFTCVKDFLYIQQNLSKGLTAIFDEQLLRNKILSERVCQTIKEAWAERINEKIAETYCMMTDLKDDFELMELDLEKKCKGPSKAEFYVNKPELEDKLREALRLRVELYKLCCFRILVVYSGCWFLWIFDVISDQSLMTIVATVTPVCAFFYMNNPHLQGTMDFLFLVDAVVENLSCKGFRVLAFSLSERLSELVSFAVKFISSLLGPQENQLIGTS